MQRAPCVLAVLSGSPYVLLLMLGALYAPALHSSVIMQGLTPVLAAGLAFVLLGRGLTARDLVSRAALIAGVILLATGASDRKAGGYWRGDLAFVATSIMWATFGTLVQRWSLKPLPTSAAVIAISMATVPLLMLLPIRLGSVPLSAVLEQGAYQGLLAGAVSIPLYLRALSSVGAAAAPLFKAVNPPVVLVGGWWLLHEAPTAAEAGGCALTIVGLVIAFAPGRSGKEGETTEPGR